MIKTSTKYTISYQTRSATHSFTVLPFITLEFSTKAAALAAAEQKAAHVGASWQTRGGIRVATPKGNLVRYVFPHG